MSDSTIPQPRRLLHITSRTTSKLPINSGVYFVHDPDSQELLYIGHATNFRSRFSQHFSKWRFHRDVVKVRLLPIKDRIERIETERALILEHRPPLNRAISTRKYESRIRIFDAAVYQSIINDPDLADMSEPSFFGLRVVGMASAPPNGNEYHYAATPIQPDGSITLTNKRERAYVTNSAWEWHSLKYYLRRIKGSNGAHEYPPYHEGKWGAWTWRECAKVLTLDGRGDGSGNWDHYEIALPEIMTRKEWKTEEESLVGIKFDRYIPAMWEAAKDFLTGVEHGR